MSELMRDLITEFSFVGEFKFLDEFEYYGKPILTRTDKKGNIIFANNMFSKMTGFSKDEYLGRPHSIVRHPGMPRAIFKELWETILLGKEWQGYIKNRTKDNKFYWVNAYIQPEIENGVIVGFSSVQRSVPMEIISKYEEIYREMRVRELMAED